MKYPRLEPFAQVEDILMKDRDPKPLIQDIG